MRTPALLIVLWACSTPSSRAEEVCAQLVEAGVAQRCETEPDRNPISIRFELVSAGSHGYVYAYDTDEAFRRARQGDGETDALLDQHGQRPHRYTHEAERVSVMLVAGADEDAQRAAQRIVDAL